jgi:hypothetical protein
METDHSSRPPAEAKTDDDDDDDEKEGQHAQNLHVGGFVVRKTPEKPKENRESENAEADPGEITQEEMPELVDQMIDLAEKTDPQPHIDLESASAEEFPGAVLNQAREQARITHDLTPYDDIEAALGEGLPADVIESINNDVPEADAELADAETEPEDGEIWFRREPEARTAAPVDDSETADEVDPSTATLTPSHGTGTPPVPHGAGGGYGSGGLPPVGLGGPGGPGFGGFNHNAMPLPTANTANTNAPEQDLDYGNPAAAALLGGIIGYFIGRRRGRIKAEKQAKKVEKRLAKQIETMHWDLKAKEAKLYKLAAAQIKHNGPAAIERLAAVPAAVKTAAETAQSLPTARAEQSMSSLRQRAPEANYLHGSSKQSEQIGHVLMAAEATSPLIKRAEQPRPNQSEIVPRIETIKITPEKHVETMSRSELLSFSERIMVEGGSLRQMYESHLIGEHGLRRLVAEHLRGGDLKKALRREVVEHEIDFERDPVMRDVAAGAGPVATGGGTATLNRLVEQASGQVSAADRNEEVAYYKARQRFEDHQQQQEHKQRQMVDIALGTVIAVLTTLVVVLYLSHR